ncbi:MAG: phosphatase PAP2 family protein [Candidatus Roizmanbacteria bacterium]|nr:phosphatase PAP2 family protein [Candidatus Roizmanbacteria bacterium]
MEKIISLDYFFTNLLNRLIPHNLFFNLFFSFFSLKGSSILIWLLVILLSVILEERKNPGITKQDKKFSILFSVSFLLTFLFSDVVLKNLFHRPRPQLISTNFNLFQFISNSCPTNLSFPSTHAATAFAAATVLTFFDKKRRWFYYTVAVIISYSRIYLGCHYFLDVIAGAIIGWLITKLILRFSISNK